MPRIQPVDPATATGKAKELLDAVQGKLGITPNVMRTMAAEPAVLDAYLALGDKLGAGSFDAKAREALALTVAAENSCDYCASAHSAISGMLKVDESEVKANLGGTSNDPKLAAALGFAKTVVEKRGNVSDADVAAVRDAGHDDGAIVEIVANVALNILTNYINHIAETDIDFPVVNTKAAA